MKNVWRCVSRWWSFQCEFMSYMSHFISTHWLLHFPQFCWCSTLPDFWIFLCCNFDNFVCELSCFVNRKLYLVLLFAGVVYWLLMIGLPHPLSWYDYNICICIVQIFPFLFQRRVVLIHALCAKRSWTSFCSHAPCLGLMPNSTVWGKKKWLQVHEYAIPAVASL